MENLKKCINNDLANNYEIYVRSFSLLSKNCNNKIPKAKNLKDDDIKLVKRLKIVFPN